VQTLPYRVVDDASSCCAAGWVCRRTQCRARIGIRIISKELAAGRYVTQGWAGVPKKPVHSTATSHGSRERAFVLGFIAPAEHPGSLRIGQSARASTLSEPGAGRDSERPLLVAAQEGVLLHRVGESRVTRSEQPEAILPV